MLLQALCAAGDNLFAEQHLQQFQMCQQAVQQGGRLCQLRQPVQHFGRFSEGEVQPRAAGEGVGEASKSRQGAVGVGRAGAGGQQRGQYRFERASLVGGRVGKARTQRTVRPRRLGKAQRLQDALPDHCAFVRAEEGE
jgi:hypothetical protein